MGITSSQEGGNPRVPGELIIRIGKLFFGSNWGVWEFDVDWNFSRVRQLQDQRDWPLQRRLTRELQEFHPIILLYITHKITRIIANFMGISKPIQSILPSLSTCNPDPSRIPEARSFVHRKIMADFCHSLWGGTPRARPVIPARDYRKPPFLWNL